jgi:hypothetical protein
MNAPGRLLAWTCAAVVALPLSPCAFFWSTFCRHEPAGTLVSFSADAPRTCCKGHSEPAQRPTPAREKPCEGDCCKISPYTTSGEEHLGLSLAPAAAVVSFGDAPAPGAILSASVVPRPLALHVLHCQWRC